MLFYLDEHRLDLTNDWKETWTVNLKGPTYVHKRAFINYVDMAGGLPNVHITT